VDLDWNLGLLLEEVDVPGDTTVAFLGVVEGLRMNLRESRWMSCHADGNQVILREPHGIQATKAILRQGYQCLHRLEMKIDVRPSPRTS